MLWFWKCCCSTVLLIARCGLMGRDRGRSSFNAAEHLMAIDLSLNIWGYYCLKVAQVHYYDFLFSIDFVHYCDTDTLRFTSLSIMFITLNGSLHWIFRRGFRHFEKKTFWTNVRKCYGEWKQKLELEDLSLSLLSSVWEHVTLPVICNIKERHVDNMKDAWGVASSFEMPCSTTITSARENRHMLLPSSF